MDNYRKQLEAEKEQLLSMMDNPHLNEGERQRGVKRVREIVDVLNELDEGNNWTQQESDTKVRIVLKDIRASRKVIRS